MSYINAIDVNEFHPYTGQDVPVVFMKVSGGDAGHYYDAKATQNYNNATRDGKVVGLYHFAGGTDPISEADFFVRACSPLAENDILCLDWEVGHPDPVGWCKQFIERVHEQTNTWCLIYMNTSTVQAHDWSPVFANSGLWVADYRFTPDQDVPCGHPYIMHQYSDVPIDEDAVFVTLEQLKEYGYHAPKQAPTPVVTPPAPTPEPTPPPAAAPVPPTPITQAPAPQTDPPALVTPPVTPEQPTEPQVIQSNWVDTNSTSFWQKVINYLRNLFNKNKKGQ